MKKGTQTQTSPYSRSVSKRSNTALCGNQGSPQPGAPRSHRASRSGIKTHRVQTIQKLAMTLFFARARCLSAGLRSWGLLADQQGIEPPLAVWKLAMTQPCSQWKGETEKWNRVWTRTMVKRDGRASTVALRVHSESSQEFFSKHHHHWGVA